MAVSKKRALVTGGSGFIGRHLISLLVEQGYQVTTTRESARELIPPLPMDLPIHACDILETEDTFSVMLEAEPDVVFHLAGLARGDDLGRLLAVNVLGTESVLHAASRLRTPPRVVLPGSAAEYGLLLDGRPVDERAELRPLSAYGLSKAAQSLLGQSTARRNQVPVVIGRVFNVIGPGEPTAMIGGSIAAQIAACEAGKQPPVIRVGNMTPTRDFVDVRDIVRALLMLSIHGQSGEIYNICSGKGRQIEDVVRQMVSLSTLEIELLRDPDRQRPSDVPCSIGDPSRLRRETGWRPAIPFICSLGDTLEWWRAVGNQQRSS